MYNDNLFNKFASIVDFTKTRNNDLPLCPNLHEILMIVRDDVFIYENSDEERELLDLIDNSLFIKELCLVHDKVANKDYSIGLKPIPFEVDEDEHIIKFCTLVKSANEPLGATIKEEGQSKIVVARIMNGGSIDRTGVLEVGDSIIQINNTLTSDLIPQEIINCLTPKNGILNMIVEPCLKYHCDKCNSTTVHEDVCVTCQNQELNQLEKVYVRSLFDYNPKYDSTHPCEEAGLELKFGDILEICDFKNDENWWQARLLASPQTDFMPTLKAVLNMIDIKMVSLKSPKKAIASIIPSKLSNQNDVYDDKDYEMILPYEQLCIFDPNKLNGRKRPVIMIIAYNNQIIDSINDIKQKDHEYPLSFFQCINTVFTHIDKLNVNGENDGEFLLFDLPKLYHLNTQNFQLIKYLLPNIKQNPHKIMQKSINVPSSPNLARHTKIQEYLSSISKITEKSGTIYLSKDEWEFENDNGNLMQSIFDDYASYKIDDMWHLLSDYFEQFIVFPTVKSLFQFRDSSLFGKLGYYVFLNIKNEDFRHLKIDNRLNDMQVYTNMNNSKTSGFKVDKIKAVFDLCLEVTNENISTVLEQFNKAIIDINTMPSFITK